MFGYRWGREKAQAFLSRRLGIHKKMDFVGRKAQSFRVRGEDGWKGEEQRRKQQRGKKEEREMREVENSQRASIR